MCTNAQSIASRHVQNIRRLGEMAEQGEQVGNLVRATIRNCLTAMETAGADAPTAVETVCNMLDAELAQLPPGSVAIRGVLESAQMHAEYLLFTEPKSLH